MLKPLFTGTATALVTPFDGSGRVDFGCLRALVEKQISGGVNAIVACGTTGEPSTMTLDERVQVVDTVVKTVAGRIPVICGTGANATAAVIENEKRMRDLGCAAQLAVTPYYNRTTQEGLYRHYMEIADKTELPIIMYNVPSRTNVDMLPATVGRLAACEKIIGLKESSYQLPSVMEKMIAADGRIAFYCGNDDLAYPMLCLGASGVISVVSNLYPEKMCEIANRFFAGDWQGAKEWQLKLLPLVRALFREVSPIPAKYAMEKLGLCGGTLRLPLCEAGEETKAEMDRVITSLAE